MIMIIIHQLAPEAESKYINTNKHERRNVDNKILINFWFFN